MGHHGLEINHFEESDKKIKHLFKNSGTKTTQNTRMLGRHLIINHQKLEKLLMKSILNLLI